MQVQYIIRYCVLNFAVFCDADCWKNKQNYQRHGTSRPRTTGTGYSIWRCCNEGDHHLLKGTSGFFNLLLCLILNY